MSIPVYPYLGVPHAVRDESRLTTTDLETVIDLRDVYATWEVCIAHVIAGRVARAGLGEYIPNRTITSNEKRQQFHEVSAYNHKKLLTKAIAMLRCDLISTPGLARETWAWINLGGDLPSLQPYYDQIADRLPTLEEFDKKLATARTRLLNE